MQEFIQQAMQALGTSEETTKSATGSLLGFLNQNGPKAEVGQLLNALPGARDMMASAAPAAAGGGGMLGSLAGAASALGVGGGGSAALVGALLQSGLSAGQAPQLISLFTGFAKTKAGPEIISKIAAAVPGLG
ncbi:MAG: hypothetical protein OEW19_11755 [Acidobacteriota bacterium]|nr:hypothetical protein [Acidobacteriota bacterium]